MQISSLTCLRNIFFLRNVFWRTSIKYEERKFKFPRQPFKSIYGHWLFLFLNFKKKIKTNVQDGGQSSFRDTFFIFVQLLNVFFF